MFHDTDMNVLGNLKKKKQASTSRQNRSYFEKNHQFRIINLKTSYFITHSIERPSLSIVNAKSNTKDTCLHLLVT